MKNVSIATAKAWIDNGDAVLVDVREPAEHAAEHITVAVNVPLSGITASQLPAHANKKIIIHCGGGSRAGKACQALLQENPQLELYVMEGGMRAWREAKLACASDGSRMLPLDRQVQLAVGAMVVIGSALAYMVDARYGIIPAFLGAGLTFAGITGFCGLGILLARMPWNATSKTQCALVK